MPVIPTIQFAAYGIHQGRTVNICTQQVRELYARGQRQFHPNNTSYGGDPAPGQTKMLVIVWEKEGGEHVGLVSEGDGTPISVE